MTKQHSSSLHREELDDKDQWVSALSARDEQFSQEREQRFMFRHVVLTRPVCVSCLVLQRTCWPRMQENVQSAWRSWCRGTPSHGCPASASTIKGNDISHPPFTAPAALPHMSKEHTHAAVCGRQLSRRLLGAALVLVVSLGKPKQTNRIDLDSDSLDCDSKQKCCVTRLPGRDTEFETQQIVTALPHDYTQILVVFVYPDSIFILIFIIILLTTKYVYSLYHLCNKRLSKVLEEK